MNTAHGHRAGSSTRADDEIIDRLLAETSLADPRDADDLRPVLMQMRRLAHGEPPVQYAELAALMGTADTSLGGRRRNKHRRTIITAAALAVSLGAGAGAAAASPDVRHTTRKAVTALINTFTPARNQQPTGTTRHADVPGATPQTYAPAPPGHPSTPARGSNTGRGNAPGAHRPPAAIPSRAPTKPLPAPAATHQP